MQRRNIAVLLLIAGTLAVAGIVWWMLLLGAKPAGPASVVLPAQPAAQPGAPASKIIKSAPAAKAVDQKELQAQEALKHQALSFVARAGSYSNSDGFASLKEVYTDASAAVQSFLESLRKDLIAAHPVSAGFWSQTTRALASRMAVQDPVLSATTTQVIVQDQVTVGSASNQDAIRYEEATVLFLKQGNQWIVTHIATKPFVP